MVQMDKQALLKRVDAALEDVRPHLAVDGGNVELVDVMDNGIVQIRWMGACEGCNMSSITMRAGIEQAIMSKVPGISGVEAVNGLVV